MPQRRHPPGFLVAACAAVALVSLTLGTIGPLLPRFEASMDSALYAALVVAGHPIGSLLAAIPTLLASRRFGLPRVIAAGAVLAFAASILFVWPGHGWWIVVARIGFGASGTVVWQSVFAWAITNTGPGRRARTIGTLLAASTSGALVAPQLGALADSYGIWLCALPPTLLLLAAGRFAFIDAYEMLERPDLVRLRAALGSQDGFAGISLTASGAIVALGFAVSLPLTLHGLGVGAFGIGAVLTAASAALVAINPAAGRLVDHGHTRAVVVSAFALLSVGLTGLALVPSAAAALPVAFVCSCLIGIPGFAGGVFTSRAVARAEADQTVSQTIVTIAWGVPALIGSIAAGALSAPETALLALAAVAALAGVLAFAERAHRLRRSARVADPCDPHAARPVRSNGAVGSGRGHRRTTPQRSVASPRHVRHGGNRRGG